MSKGYIFLSQMCKFRFYVRIIKIAGKQVFFPSQFTSEDNFQAFQIEKKSSNFIISLAYGDGLKMNRIRYQDVNE